MMKLSLNCAFERTKYSVRESKKNNNIRKKIAKNIGSKWKTREKENGHTN